MLFFCDFTFAQINVKGNVQFKSKGMPGVNVIVKGTFEGTSTDINGNYNLSINDLDSAVLIFSLLGFEKEEIKIFSTKSDYVLNVKLKEKFNELQTVEITAGIMASGSDLKKSTILSDIDIATMAGAEADIFTAMQSLPGIQNNNLEEGIMVRGGLANETKILFDELWVHKPFMNDLQGVNQRGKLSAFEFKKTSISTGAYSASVGNALSSVLMMESKDLADKTTTDIGLMSLGASISHTQRFKESSLNLNYMFADLTLSNWINENSIDWENSPRSNSIGASYKSKFNKSGLFKTHVNYVANTGAFNFINQDAGLSLLDNHDQSIYTNSTLKSDLNSSLSYFIGLATNNQINTLSMAGINMQRIDNFIHTRFKLIHHINKKNIINYGIDHSNTFKDQYLSGLNRNITENIYAAFIDYDKYINHNFIIRAGLRIDYSDVLDDYVLAPRIATSYKINHHNFSIGIGEYYQTVDDALLIQHKNSELDFEKSEHYLINYFYDDAHYTFRVEAYAKQYSSLTTTDISNNTISNNGYGYANGIDLFFRDKKSIKRLDYWITYSCVDTKRKYLEFDNPIQPSLISKHNINLISKYYISKIRTQLSCTYSYASPREFYFKNDHVDVVKRTNHQHNFSFNFSYLTSIHDHFSILYVSFGNLMNPRNIQAYRSSQGNIESIGSNTKRNIFLGIFISIGDDKVFR